MSVEGNTAALVALASKIEGLATDKRPREAAAQAANDRLRKARTVVTGEGVSIQRTDNGVAFCAPSVADDMGAAIDAAMGQALSEVGR